MPDHRSLSRLPIKIVRKLSRSLTPWLAETVDRLLYRTEMLEAHMRMLSLHTLRSQYEPLLHSHSKLNQYELSVYSQNGEDGILFNIFSRIGTTNRYFVEFGIEDGKETNTANLSLNFGWQGLLLDGDAAYVAKARNYYAAQLGTQAENVHVAHAFITRENINTLFETNGVPPEIDLLSIDIDGNDYWVWERLSATHPRVVVIEYNASFGDEQALVVEYDAQFNRLAKHPSGFYHGASLPALQKLGRDKGYRLVGCDSRGVNAFFVRNDVAQEKLVELTAQQAYFPHAQRIQTLSTADQYKAVVHLPFVRLDATPKQES